MRRVSAVVVVTLFALVLVVAPVAEAGDVDVSEWANGPATAAQSDLVTLTVEVQTNEGDPVAGARVEVTYDGGSNTTETFSNGQALVDVPRGADVTVDVTDDEFVVNQPVTAQNVDSETTVAVEMFPKATAVVEVRDDTGVLRDAQVTLRKVTETQAVARGTTGSNGVFQAEAIEAGTYQVSVVKRGYLARSIELDLASPSSGATVTLEEASVDLTVRVFDDHFRTDQPLGGAEVSVVVGDEAVRSGLTTDNGRLQLAIGANGRYRVRVTKDGYTTAEREIVVGESGQSLEFRIERTPSLSVTTGADRVLVGESVLVQVKNAYGEPAEGVLVRRNGTNVGTTDADGEIRVEIPDTGDYEIVATSDEAESDPVVVSGFEAATPTTEATPTPTPTATATVTPTEEPDALPGFGLPVALLALLAVAAIAARRRS